MKEKQLHNALKMQHLIQVVIKAIKLLFIIILIFFSFNSKTSFGQNPFTNSIPVQELVDRVEKVGANLAKNDDLWFIAEDKLNKTFKADRIDNLKWKDEFISMKYIKHTPLNDAANWFYFISVKSKNTSTPYYIYHDPQNTTWGTYTMLARNALPKEFDEYIKKVNLLFEMKQLGASNREEYLEKKLGEIIKDVKGSPYSNQFADAQILWEIKKIYRSYKESYPEFANQPWFTSALDSANTIATELHKKWLYSYVEEEYNKDIVKSNDLIMSWIKNKSELLPKRVNIAKTIFSNVLDPDELDNRKKYELEQARKLADEKKYKEIDAINKSLIKEIAKLIEIDSSYIRRVVESIFPIGKDYSGNENYLWAQKNLPFFEYRDGDYHILIPNEDPWTIIFLGYTNSIPQEEPLEECKFYNGKILAYNPKNEYNKVLEKAISYKDSVDFNERLITDYLKDKFCFDFNSGKYLNVCYDKKNINIYEGMKILVKDALNNIENKGEKNFNKIRKLYPDETIRLNNDAKNDFYIQIQFGNARILDEMAKIKIMNNLYSYLQKIELLLKSSEVKKINRAFKEIKDPNEIREIIDSFN
jgi:hypothetical protein